MNEESQLTTPKALQEAPAPFRAGGGSDEASDREVPELRPEDLPGKDLRGEDLTRIEGLLPEHLAGADLTGARLPDDIAKFPALGQVAAISGEARKVFVALLAACVYSWLVIGTTQDFLGELACGPDVAETQGLAWRALGPESRDRLFAQLLAARLIGPDCPPAKELPEDMHRRLEELAGRGDAAAAVPKASSSAPTK